MSAATMRERFAETTTELLGEDLSLALVLGDISVSMFDGAQRRFPDRVVNVGIREQLLISVGAGLALSGMRPIMHTIASFLVERPFEQVKLDFGHQGIGGVLVSAGASYDYAESGRTHHSPGDVALLDTLPGWTVHVPGHADELDALLRAAASGDGQVYLRTSTQANQRPQPVDAAGRMVVVRRGGGRTVVAVGPMLDPVLAAVEGLDATVLYAATVRPFDATTLRAVVGDGSEVVLVEPYLAGTSTWLVAEALQDSPHRLLSVGVPRIELRRYGTPADHAAAYGLDPAGLRRRLVRV